MQTYALAAAPICKKANVYKCENAFKKKSSTKRGKRGQSGQSGKRDQRGQSGKRDEAESQVAPPAKGQTVEAVHRRFIANWG
ncbi:hypothetical protein POVWA1_061450 [Plasmodium ovale wallikeri]|uniref:Uncharacterized protein n=1 Tax=Plasmodium ovale wallikeri TaxID=864142 RepID=A0A1A9A317_PLAOA|nr:hypothetical protein POVWA1_061450 [Plasmodium ovale wallikeri]